MSTRGHVARVQFVCSHCKQCSRVLSGHYLANQKLVHAFTCAGMLSRQYMNFALFAGMGVVKQKYISSVYLNKLYQQVVADVAEESMKAAVERVKESPHHATSGEVNMSQKTVLVFGGSGTVGQGLIRVLLENACRVVAVFRSVESEEKAKRRLGNPPENALITVIGALDSEEDAAMLKANVCKAGEITDVVASIGGWWQKGPVLEQSLDEYNKVYGIVRPVPNAGFITMFAGALVKLVSVVQAEYHTKPVRVNEFCIGCYVQPWDAVTSGSVSNLDMGRAIAGVVIHPSTRGASLQVGANNMEKLATSGSL
eukprot:Em0016g842a